MSTKIENAPKLKEDEETKNNDTISSEEENSENGDGDQNDSPKNNLASFVTTPYERVLSIINEAKAFILSVSSTQQNLINGLEWAIKIISSHNLYTYEFKEHEDTEDFKQFVQFVNSYNDVIPTNKKPTGKKSFLTSSLDLKRPSALKYAINIPIHNQIQKIEEEKNDEQSSDIINNEKTKDNPINIKKDNKDKNNKMVLNTDTNVKIKEIKNKILNKNNSEINKKNENKNNIKNKFNKHNNTQTVLRNVNKNKKETFSKLEKSENSKIQKSASKINKSTRNFSTRPEKIIKPLSPIRPLKKSTKNIITEKNITNTENNIAKSEKKSTKTENNICNTEKNINANDNILTPKEETKACSHIKTHSSMDLSKSTQIETDNYKPSKSSKVLKTFNRLKSESFPVKSFNFLKDDDKLEESPLNKSFTKYSSNLIENALIDINYPPSRILEKTFNIFELKEIIGQDNVLPIMGKVILDSFGLYSDDIISTEKLDPFLVSISNQYHKTTLYHNSMHGADVTQSLCLYFLNSNAEEICQSLILDLLGILIAALGHDLGHPGLTNPFHINSSSELAITYNDVSCLENFHASTLFKTIRNPDTDIFEKLSVQDYKAIRKRMIGNILATDMVNHGKIMTLIKSRIAINKAENKTKFELLSGNEKTKYEEQQSLFDFLIHAADLAHNTKLFNISLKWVELLSEEFWLQGDKEKSMNLPVSFLCDRDNYNIPQSQVGFIKGFIIPTFDCLVDIFPSLKFTMCNAKTNLKKWEKLASKGRLKGWTPEKTKQVNYKKKMILFSSISSLNENNNINIKSPMHKRKSGNVNSLSHALQVKDAIKENNKENQEKNEKKNKNAKNKVQRPNIILKSKNHDKKINLHKFQKFK